VQRDSTREVCGKNSVRCEVSRSVAGGKGPGYEYWTARPFNRAGHGPGTNGGKYHKQRTHKAERQIARAEVRESDPLDGYVLYRCQSCGWLTRDDMESRYCCECDEWARWKPVIHRPR
jgi:hypothetical protein